MARFLSYTAEIPALGWKKTGLYRELQAQKFLLPKLINGQVKPIRPLLKGDLPDTEKLSRAEMEEPVVGIIKIEFLLLSDSKAVRARSLGSFEEVSQGFALPEPQTFVGGIDDAGNHILIATKIPDVK